MLGEYLCNGLRESLRTAVASTCIPRGVGGFNQLVAATRRAEKRLGTTKKKKKYSSDSDSESDSGSDLEDDSSDSDFDDLEDEERKSRSKRKGKRSREVKLGQRRTKMERER